MALHVRKVSLVRAATCSCGPSLLALGTAALVALGCGAGPTPADAPHDATREREHVSLTCPSLSGKGNADLAALFGIDASLAAKLERALRLSTELEETADALLAKTTSVCTTIATDIDPAPIGSRDAACRVAAERLAGLRAKLGASGVKLVIATDDLRCTVPGREIATCGGECLTGVPGVVTKLECSGARSKSTLASPSTSDECSGDVQLPNAPPSCLAQCRARALRHVKCDADVTVTADGADPTLTATLASLKRDIPALLALGTESVVRATSVATDVGTIVDDVAGAVDAMTSGGSVKTRSVAVGAVLATCVAPPLARTVQASRKLASSLDGAKTLSASLAAR